MGNAGPGRPWSEPLLWGRTLGLGSRAGRLSTCANCSVGSSSDRNPRKPDHLTKHCEPNAIFRQVDPKRKGRGRPELCLPGSCSGTFYQISCPIFLGVEGGQGCRTHHLPCLWSGRRQERASTYGLTSPGPRVSTHRFSPSGPWLSGSPFPGGKAISALLLIRVTSGHVVQNSLSKGPPH